MKIGIDIDGVITDIVPYIFELGSKYMFEQGEDVLVKQPLKYDTYNIYGWNDEKEQIFWDEIMKDYFLSGKARMFASEVITELKKRGHEIIIITARYYKDHIDTWLKNENIPYDKLYKTAKKDIIVEKEKLDIMIEDSTFNIRDIEKYCDIIVFDNIYNRDIENHKRVYSWYEILKIIIDKEKQLNNK